MVQCGVASIVHCMNVGTVLQENRHDLCRPLIGRLKKDSPASEETGVDTGPSRNEELRNLSVVTRPGGGGVEWNDGVEQGGQTVLVRLIHFGTAVEQGLDGQVFRVGDGKVQGGVPVLRLGVEVRLLGQEEGDQVSRTVVGCKGERSDSRLALCSQVCSFGKEKLRDLHISFLRRSVESRKTTGIPDHHPRTSLDQNVHCLKIAGKNSINQGCSQSLPSGLRLNLNQSIQLCSRLQQNRQIVLLPFLPCLQKSLKSLVHTLHPYRLKRTNDTEHVFSEGTHVDRVE
mmetsp:Transcript_55296/g.108207  ORF Transcript_55296/g.108207 Transcript_55296/m.108207 type:complete len:286 (-) Transcript_55296:496-1353(-)